MHILIIGNDCLKKTENNCSHIVKSDDQLLIWDIDKIREKIFNYDKVIFAEEDLNLIKGENIFEKCNKYPQLRHYIGNDIKSSRSEEFCSNFNIK